MADFKTLDEAALKEAATRGRRMASTPKAVSARYDKRTARVIVELDTGIGLSLDPKRAYGLAEAAADGLMGVTVDEDGEGLHFPRLDADFTVEGLLEGFLGPLSWTRRQARASASRNNGRLGGRPRKGAPSDPTTTKADETA